IQCFQNKNLSFGAHHIKNNCSKNKKTALPNGNAVEKINDYLFENWLVCDRCLRQTKGATRA
ncbi:MAG: hypothetical protein ACLR6O_10155, partial [Eubacterium sp.]